MVWSLLSANTKDWDSWIWRFRCLLFVPYLETLFFFKSFLLSCTFFFASLLPSSLLFHPVPWSLHSQFAQLLLSCSLSYVDPLFYDKITFLNNANTLSLKLSIKPTSILFCLYTGIIGTIPSGVSKQNWAFFLSRQVTKKFQHFWIIGVIHTDRCLIWPEEK